MNATVNLREYVYRGIWKMENVPASRAWIWTLSDSHALIVLAIFTLILTFTQRQAWCIVRETIARWKRPVRLADNTCLDPLQHLSQLEALKEIAWSGKFAIRSMEQLILARRSDNGRIAETTSTDFPVVSPYFGILALINIGIFVVAGVAIPWLLSEGWQIAPIVRSKMLEDCVTSSRFDHIDTIVDEYPNVEAIFQPCNGRPGRGCEDEYYLRVPEIEKVRIKDCPFEEEICYRDTASLRMSHFNLTAFEAGINTKSKINISRRITCTPVISEPFIVPLKNRNLSALSIHSNNRLERFKHYILETRNGPNKYSNLSSGLMRAQANGVNDLFILPNPIFEEHVRNDPPQIHPLIRRIDGMPFLIVQRGGTLSFIRGVVDDPFFSAHQRYRNQFVSDYEATTLGCVEQIQCCISDSGECSAWGTSSQQMEFLREKFGHDDQSQGLSSMELSIENADHLRITELLWSSFSMYQYIGSRWIFDRLVPPLQRSIGASGKIDDRHEQWVIEVEKWFVRALVGGILSVRDGMRWNTDNTLSSAPIEERQRYTLCGRVLFRDSGHTNISCLGLFVTLVALCLICYPKPLQRVGARVHSSFKKLNMPNVGAAFDKFVNTFVNSSQDSSNQGSWQQGTGDLRDRYQAALTSIKRLSKPRKRGTPINEPEAINFTDLNTADTSNHVTGQAWWENIDGVI